MDKGFTDLAYDADPKFTVGFGDFALLSGRIVCRVMDIWVGDQPAYRLEPVSFPERGGIDRGTPFWITASNHARTPYGLILFSKNDL